MPPNVQASAAFFSISIAPTSEFPRIPPTCPLSMSLPRRRRARAGRGGRVHPREVRRGRVGAMRASAFSPRLDVRERIPSGPTGALSVLFEAEGASVSGAHVAYPRATRWWWRRRTWVSPRRSRASRSPKARTRGRPRANPRVASRGHPARRAARSSWRGGAKYICARPRNETTTTRPTSAAFSFLSALATMRVGERRPREVRGEGGGCRLDERRNGVRLGGGGR